MANKPDTAEPSGPAFKPVLGLSDEPGEPLAIPVRAGTVFDQPEPEQLIELTVIIPARNEEQNLPACLESLVAQSEDIFHLGRDWELIVVNDQSADRTAEIARSFPGVTLLEAAKLERGWTGKNNAIWTAARKARGRWLLFTDADTIHEPGDLHRAIHEATRHKAGMLELFPPPDRHRLRAAYPDATGLLRTGPGLPTRQGLRPQPAHRRRQRPIPSSRTRSLPPARRPRHPWPTAF